MYEEIPIEELVKFQPKKLREYTISNADYTDHACSYICRLSGGFIVFGGWLKVFIYNNTAPVMAYAASEANPEGGLLFFNRHSHIIASVKPNTSRAPFLGGGTVNWEKA